MRERHLIKRRTAPIMKKLTLVLTIVFTTLICLQGVSFSKPNSEGHPDTLAVFDESKGVSITIYNANIGLVKDLRDVTLTEGLTEIRFTDVASGIIPASVSIKTINGHGGFRVLEQNYEYDLLSPQKLLDKYVGKEVRLYQKNPYTGREEIVTATLLSNNGSPIFRIAGEITFGHPGRIIFPSVPENLISKPTLLWLVENSVPSSGRTVEVTYLTNGINWRADYVLTLNDGDDRADLSGWVTIDNRSGTAYSDARIKLVAGDINRVRGEAEYRNRMLASAMKEATPSMPQFQEEEFFEYHMYTLQRKATIKDNQTKQISLLGSNGIPIKKEFVYRGARHYYHSRYGEAMKNQKVGVFIKFKNRKENNLGMPLPRGIVRVYKQDSEGSPQFVGEDLIDHTPRDEELNIKMGDAFDVIGERRQMDWKKLASDTYEAEFEITLRNHKEEDIVVRVIEPIPGDWKILSTSHQFIKTEAFTAEFNIDVPKDREVKLRYRVRMRF